MLLGRTLFSPTTEHAHGRDLRPPVMQNIGGIALEESAMGKNRAAGAHMIML